MAEWDGNESSCPSDCGFDIPKGGCLDALTVKDITDIANLIYPVGAVYMSVNNVSPATLFGGTWKQIKDCFLLAAGDTYNGGSTGGNAQHNHVSPVGYNSSNKYLGISYRQGSQTVSVSGIFAALSQSVSISSGTYSWTLPNTSTTSNMPPYLTVYVWERTA